MKAIISRSRFSILCLGTFILQVFALHGLYAQRDSIVFKYKAEPQSWKVPKGVTQIHVDAYGAQGGGSELGGKGGRVESDLEVKPGTDLIVRVGSQPADSKGGFNGGGKGCGNGTGGGGATDIRIDGSDLDARVLVAGGGGGMGYMGFAGAGGGMIGGDGGMDTVDYHVAKGGTQESGGAGARVYSTPSGEKGKGGNGISSRGVCVNDAMGGGGGGYYGGGGGGAGGAGGGSSFTNKKNTNVIHTQGVAQGNGRLTISWEAKK
jgi:hypothetical protein